MLKPTQTHGRNSATWIKRLVKFGSAAGSVQFDLVSELLICVCLVSATLRGVFAHGQPRLQHHATDFSAREI